MGKAITMKYNEHRDVYELFVDGVFEKQSQNPTELIDLLEQIRREEGLDNVNE